MRNFQPFEDVGRVSEKQLQVAVKWLSMLCIYMARCACAVSVHSRHLTG